MLCIGCEVSSRRSLLGPSFNNFDVWQTYLTFLETTVFGDSKNDGKNLQIGFIWPKIRYLLKFIFYIDFTFNPQFCIKTYVFYLLKISHFRQFF
jgi:hypothetical protein